jgi:hypothetical protein
MERMDLNLSTYVNVKTRSVPRESIRNSDDMMAIMMEKHKLEPSRPRPLSNARFESPLIGKMEKKYGHLFGRMV